MQDLSVSRRAVLGAGTGFAAASSLGWGAALAHEVTPQVGLGYPGVALARQFVSIGSLRSIRTAGELAQYFDNADHHAASKDLLFCPDLEPQAGNAGLEQLTAIALKHDLWLAFHPAATAQLAVLTVNHSEGAATAQLETSASGLLPTRLGNLAFAVSTAESSLAIRDSEIVLQAGAPASRPGNGTYCVTRSAVYGPGGDVLETAADSSQLLISARIPIAAFRAMRTN